VVDARELFDILCQEAIDAAQNALTLLTWNRRDVTVSNSNIKETRRRNEVENVVDNRFAGLT